MAENRPEIRNTVSMVDGLLNQFLFFQQVFVNLFIKDLVQGMKKKKGPANKDES